MSSEAAKSVKFLTHPPCAYHTGTDITYIQLLTDNKTALMYKNKSKNEVFVQSSSWFWLLQQFSTQLQKTHKNLYSISSGSLFGFSNTCYKRSLRLRSILQVSSCQRVLLCAFLYVVWTHVDLFFLHNTIQVHRSLSANTCRDEPLWRASLVMRLM